MKVGSTLNIALRALRRNKMRSVLTALGIIIGVAAVIAMVGIGNGAKAQVEAQIASLGQNVILIYAGSVSSSGIHSGWGGAGTLKIDNALAMKRVMGRTTLGSINVQADNSHDLPLAQQQIIGLLRQRHNIRPGKDDDFTVRNQEEIAAMATATARVMTLLLGSIAGVSLVVG